MSDGSLVSWETPFDKERYRGVSGYSLDYTFNDPSSTLEYYITAEEYATPGIYNFSIHSFNPKNYKDTYADMVVEVTPAVYFSVEIHDENYILNPDNSNELLIPFHINLLHGYDINSINLISSVNNAELSNQIQTQVVGLMGASGYIYISIELINPGSYNFTVQLKAIGLNGEESSDSANISVQAN